MRGCNLPVMGRSHSSLLLATQWGLEVIPKPHSHGGSSEGLSCGDFPASSASIEAVGTTRTFQSGSVLFEAKRRHDEWRASLEDCGATSHCQAGRGCASTHCGCVTGPAARQQFPPKRRSPEGGR